MEVITFQDFERPVNVSGYDPKGPVDMALKTVFSGMAYNVPGSGKVVIIIVHQAINIPHLPHNLLNPMQVRVNDVVVNEAPKFQCANFINLSYTITVKGENLNAELVIPLDLFGVVSCFTTRKLTQEEFVTCDRYELTYENPVYDPSGLSYAKQEAAMMDSRGELKVVEEKHPLRRQLCPVHMDEKFSDTIIKLQTLSLILDDSSLLQEMMSHVHISEVSMPSLMADIRDGGGVDVVTLAKNFGIGIEAAKITRLVTTKKEVKWMIHPSLSVRLRTNYRQLRYRRLPVTCFTDTMFSNSNSRQGKKAAQVFCTADGWTSIFPMAKEKDAHGALSLLFHPDGIPNVMVMDGAKAHIQGDFQRKLREAGCHIKQTDPYTPKSNAAVGSIRELKRGIGREMVRSGAPKRIWDNCSVREIYIRSSTAL
jgi:hypothetical protein